MDLRPLRKFSSHLWQFTVLVSLGVVITGCVSSALAGMPVAADLFSIAAQSTYVLAPSDATATPTPFQPLAPTASLGENPLAHSPPSLSPCRLFNQPRHRSRQLARVLLPPLPLPARLPLRST